MYSGNILPEQRHFAAMPFQYSGKNLLGGGFPGAVRTQEPKNLSVVYSKIKTVQRLFTLFVGKCQVLYINHLHHPISHAGYSVSPAGGGSTILPILPLREL